MTELDLKPKGKIFTPDYVEETKLPDGVYWENLIDKPMTVEEMSSNIGKIIRLFQSGNIRLEITNDGINFYTSNGIYSGSLYGIGTNNLQMMIDIDKFYDFGYDFSIPGAISIGRYADVDGPESGGYWEDGTIYYDTTNKRFRALSDGLWYTMTLV